MIRFKANALWNRISLAGYWFFQLFLLCPWAIPGRAQEPGRMNPGLDWGAYAGGKQEVFTAQANPSVLARQELTLVGIAGCRPFLLPETGIYRLALVRPLSSGGLGFSASFQQFAQYRETGLQLAYARPLHEVLDLGLAFSWREQRVPVFGGRRGGAAAVAMMFHFSPHLQGGWSAWIPFESEGFRLPVEYSMGIGIRSEQDWSATVELLKSGAQPALLRAGLRYRPGPWVRLTLGYSSGDFPAWFSFEFPWKSIKLLLFLSLHQRLGISPGLGLISHFEGPANRAL